MNPRIVTEPITGWWVIAHDAATARKAYLPLALVIVAFWLGVFAGKVLAYMGVL